MDLLLKRVATVRRRLQWQRFQSAFWRTLFVMLCLAVLAQVASKIWVAPVEGYRLAGICLGAALGLSILIAAVWTYLHRYTALRAAIEVDRRCALNERVSSALALSSEQLETDVGQAVVNDAIARLERVDLAHEFGSVWSRRALLPLAPAAISVILLFVAEPQRELAAETTAAAEAKAQVKQSVQTLERKLEQREAEAKAKQLKDAEGLFEKLREGARDLAKKDEADRRQGLTKLNDLAKEVEKRREQLGGNEQIKQQLRQLEDLQKGAASKLTKALREGDFRKAAEELEKLQNQLDGKELSAEQRQELAEQIEQMQRKLEDAAAAHEQARERMAEQIKQMNEAGQSEQARQLQQQLDRLNEQSQQMDQIQQMAEQMGKAAQSMKEGNTAQASQAMQELSQQLDQLAQQADESEMLSDALEEIQEAKNSMNCGECNGQGCKACNGGNKPGGDRPGGNQPSGGRSDKWSEVEGGNGLGAGRGKGERPQQETDFGTRDVNARQKVGRGGAVRTGEVSGPNLRGRIQQQMREATTSAAADNENPSNQQRLPRDQREHVQQYFDTLREGARE